MHFPIDMLFVVLSCMGLSQYVFFRLVIRIKIVMVYVFPLLISRTSSGQSLFAYVDIKRISSLSIFSHKLFLVYLHLVLIVWMWLNLLIVFSPRLGPRSTFRFNCQSVTNTVIQVHPTDKSQLEGNTSSRYINCESVPSLEF